MDNEFNDPRIKAAEASILITQQSLSAMASRTPLFISVAKAFGATPWTRHEKRCDLEGIQLPLSFTGVGYPIGAPSQLVRLCSHPRVRMREMCAIR
jgi:hypothetical protein